MKTIVIGCDNAAVSLKKTLADFIRSKGYEVEDLGCDSREDPRYYPDIAAAVCQKIIHSGYKKRGLLVCGTGLGMAITANKFKGIRAAVCHDAYSCERSVLSNNCNVICMGERVIGQELAKMLIGQWLPLVFVDGSSTPKVQAIGRIEEQNFMQSGCSE
jgi:ribose 5-phosphate isomerase B